MNSYLDELYAHQEWADTEHWRAFEGHAGALDDKAIRERLVHIHLVQHGFLWVTGEKKSGFEIKTAGDFADVAELKSYARRGNADLSESVKNATVEWLETIIEVPWFKPALRISRRLALTQAAMHSHYHRGQNATRLRELGGVPPLIDFIAWLHKGQPKAQWS